jgi:8-oxo-dGTP pyrophosphatase MutT (NUDIX family)
MAHELSCGVIVRRRGGELLMCRATGRNYWDIPKGVLDPGETPIEAALRELREEAAITLAAAAVRDLGMHRYLQRKDLHLFVVDPPQPELSADGCHCTTYFIDHFGRTVPEVDAYRWVARDDVRGVTGKNMARVLMSLEW